MPGKRNEDDKRARLIRAVGDTLRGHGYEGLGLNKIALRAGVSKPMVYRYFDGLNGLLKLILSGVTAGFPIESLSLPENPTTEEVKCCLIKMLQDQFRYFSLKAVMALLVGGIYFNVLHESADAGTMAGVDIKNEKDFGAMLTRIALLVEWAFDMAGQKNKDH